MTENSLQALVVDDSKIVRKVTRGILEKLGYQVDEAEDGSVALSMCQQKMPYLIMLDWHMPVLDGLGFLKELRKQPGGDAPVVIFCTTETDFSRIQEAITCGANEYVMKPFDGDIIANKLDQLGLPHGG